MTSLKLDLLCVRSLLLCCDKVFIIVVKMTKTSPSQFEMLVTFMEQHGDLSKLSTSNARGRITSIRNWEELTVLLNSDGAGATKTTEKWKKAWSDFKNNTKKKAARLHRAASGTGGGPAVFAKLTDLEQRVLNLLGLQVATGLEVEEAGLSQGVHIQPNPNNDDEQGSQTLHQLEEYSQNVNQNETNVGSAQSPPPVLRAISSPPFMFVEQEVESSQTNWHEPGPSRLSIAPAQSPPQARPTTAASHITLIEARVEETALLSPTRPSSQVRVGHVLTPSVPTTPRRARRTRGSPRRRARPAQTEQAAQHFLQADSFWRNFKEQQHNDNMEFRREENRLREMEVQAQREWQAIGGRLVNVLEKLADKYCKD